MCTKQRDYCFSLTRKERKQFYGNLDTKDNKKFLENNQTIVSG